MSMKNYNDIKYNKVEFVGEVLDLEKIREVSCVRVVEVIVMMRLISYQLLSLQTF
jgi:hypothetical protein